MLRGNQIYIENFAAAFTTRADHPMIGSRTRKDEALDRITDGIAQLTSSDEWIARLGV